MPSPGDIIREQVSALEALALNADAFDRARKAAEARAEQLQGEATKLADAVHELEETVGEGETLLQERATEIVKLKARVAELEAQQPAPVPPVTPPPSTLPKIRLGVNLAANVDWDTAARWVNLRNGLRRWENPTGGVYTGELSPDGYPLTTDALTVGFFKGYPAGDYGISWGGKATLTWNGVAVASGGSVKVRSDGQPNTLKVSGLDKATPFRDLGILDPVDAGATYRSPYLDKLRDFDAARFMDLGYVNSGQLTEWTDRPTPTTCIQTAYQPKPTDPVPKGVCYEHMITLCNEIQKPGWVCVPYLASDDYKTKMATLWRDTYEPTLPLYVEYDNELWNSSPGFKAYPWLEARTQAAKASGATPPRSLFPHQCAFEFVGTSKIFRSVLGDRARMVFGGMASSPWHATESFNWIVKNYGPVKNHASHLAITLYYDLKLVAGMTPDQYMDKLIARCAENWQHIADHKALAAKHGVELCIYEGGAHPNTKEEGDIAVTHPRAGEFLTKWAASIERQFGAGTLACHYNDVDPRWGLRPALNLTTSKTQAAAAIAAAN